MCGEGAGGGSCALRRVEESLGRGPVLGEQLESSWLMFSSEYWLSFPPLTAMVSTFYASDASA